MLTPEEGCIFCFNKPYALTSFRVVSRVRGILCNRLGTKKLAVGHAGTLDPLATGVLIVCTGKATKQIDTLQAGTKEYIAQLRLGATTPSFDRETAEDFTFPTEHLSRALIEETLQRFKGRIEQIPPAFSAVKVDGKRAFKMARKGVDVELKPKVLVIDEIELLDCDLTPAKPSAEKPAAICIKHLSDEDVQRLRQQPPLDGFPTMTVRVVCSKGTYIRALARDIGAALGTGAYLSGLIRTRIGQYRLADCLDPDTFEQYVDEQGVQPSTAT